MSTFENQIQVNFMEENMDDKNTFCPSCGSQCSQKQAFCTKCGAKLSKEERTCQKRKSEKEPEEEIESFSTFYEAKEKERQSFFSFKKKSKERKNFFSKKKDKNDKEGTLNLSMNMPKSITAKPITINVGLAEVSEKSQVLGILRGSKRPVRVQSNFGYIDTLKAAVSQHANHNQYFCGSEDYVILYPDLKIASKIPGTDLDFTIERYKVSLCKPYSKIDLYLCLQYQFESNDECDNLNVQEATINVDGLRSKALTHIQHEELAQEQSCSTEFDPKSPVSLDVSWLPLNQKGLLDNNEIIHTLDNCKSIESRTMRCPICNKELPLDNIQEHADACLNDQAEQSPFSVFESIATAKDDQDMDNDIMNNSFEEDKEGNVMQNLSLDNIIKDVKDSMKKCVITEGDCYYLDVRRRHCFEDFRKFFSKKWNKANGKSIRVSFLGEEGIDTGGLSREFYSEALIEVRDTFFSGDMQSGFEPSCGLISITDGTMARIGHLFATSVCNGGPGPGFLAPWVYNFLVGGLKDALKNLPERLPAKNEYSKFYGELLQCNSDNDLQRIFMEDGSLDILQAIGFRGNPAKATINKKEEVLRSILTKVKIEPQSMALSQIAEGMRTYNLLAVMQSNKHLYSHVFCPSEKFIWTHNLLKERLMPVFSENESNRKVSEITIYKYFVDFLETCFNDDECPVIPANFMKFITGSPVVPAIGGPEKIKIYFKHDCKRNEKGHPCRCYPTTSTCAFTVTLPVHISSEEEMINSFSEAITMDPGFGLS